MSKRSQKYPSDAKCKKHAEKEFESASNGLDMIVETLKMTPSPLDSVDHFAQNFLALNSISEFQVRVLLSVAIIRLAEKPSVSLSA